MWLICWGESAVESFRSYLLQGRIGRNEDDGMLIWLDEVAGPGAAKALMTVPTLHPAGARDTSRPAKAMQFHCKASICS